MASGLVIQEPLFERLALHFEERQEVEVLTNDERVDGSARRTMLSFGRKTRSTSQNPSAASWARISSFFAGKQSPS
jgi:hypothetical protein